EQKHLRILAWSHPARLRCRRFPQPAPPTCLCDAPQPQRASHHRQANAHSPRQCLTMHLLLLQLFDSLGYSCTPPYDTETSATAQILVKFSILGFQCAYTTADSYA